MTRSYAVLVEREEEGGYSAYVPDLPGCASEGETYDEALSNIRKAIHSHIAELKADGLPAPEPRTTIARIEVKLA